jgi:hypothetical protein
LSALIVLVLLGWVQLFVFNSMGFDIFPLDFKLSGEARSGIWHYGGDAIFRMSSLGGEPKDLSVSLIIGFFLLHISNRSKIFYFKYDTFWKYAMLLTAFATLSTSGFVMFAILLTIYYLQLLFSGQLKLSFNIKTVMVAIVLIGSVFIFVSEKSAFVTAIFEERISGRDIASEDWDAPIQILFMKEPQYFILGLGLGNVHHLAYKYIPSEYSHYMSDNIFTAKSGYLKIFSEIGAVGFWLFLLMNYKVIVFMRKVSKKTRDIEIKQMNEILYFTLLILLFAFFARSYIFSQYILFFAVGLSVLQINQRRINLR